MPVPKKTMHEIFRNKYYVVRITDRAPQLIADGQYEFEVFVHRIEKGQEMQPRGYMRGSNALAMDRATPKK